MPPHSLSVFLTTGLRSSHDDMDLPIRESLLLSEERARMVAQALAENGIPKNIIFFVGVGSAHPLVPTPKGTREPQNRRAEISFISMTQPNKLLNMVPLSPE